ncbi:disulfide oxidoreductase [Marinococcus halotolerans]|uniref:disulfide oxidoreductase n=1 Tax=Marinococcus halotolerans TaxID=301092 RepID=UPI0003B57795|nr:disulfide oxidoreductase [Marinococcus halotolerans]
MDRSLSAAWLVAIIATLGSLSFSEILGYTPCELCWYQRILMYPLAVILGIAIFRGERQVIWYALPLAVPGMLLAGYHYLYQKLPVLQQAAECTGAVSCSDQSAQWLGFITIPLLSFTAFLIISIALLVIAVRKK